ncbi:MAG TPA: SAM-dependent chlorinase/fluorinase [Planctomycetota bacterium]|nr:SAM-dependent chlorinase/fluorinase [Planctomycetota bacterium]
MELPRPCGVVALLTDFGLVDPFVGVMKGVIKQRNVQADVVDYCHGVPAHDVETGAFYLGAAIGRFPVGTVFVAVVDPGVGTARRALAACAAGCYWLAPDNGVLEPVLARDDAEVRTLDLDKLRLRPVSRTFHGRDVFAPVAGMLSGARFGFRALGDRCPDPMRLPGGPFAGPSRVVSIDRFGNLLTNVPGARVLAEGWRAVRVGEHEVPVHGTYGEVPPGRALALINSYDLLEIAVNAGRADEQLAVAVGARLEPIVH